MFEHRLNDSRLPGFMLTAARKIQRKEVTEHYKDLINVSFAVDSFLVSRTTPY